MKMPTPVDQLPSFSSGGTVSSQPGSNKWLPYIIVGGVLITAIAIAVAMNRSGNRKKFKIEENESETS
jgi:hypothetical protein